MRRYMIERDIPGAGNLSANALQSASQTSCTALHELGPDIQWVQSHVTEDRIYCVYLAESEGIVVEHARRAGLPATKVSEVRQVIDPMTAAGVLR